MAYPLDDTLAAGQTGHLTDHQLLHKRYNYDGPKVKGDFGAVGDSHHNNGGGTDDTTAFQNAIDAAHAAGVGQFIIEPGTYRITSPLKMHKSDGTGGPMVAIGIGYRNNGNLRGPVVVWDGPTDGTARAMFDYDTTAANVGMSPVYGVTFAGRWIDNATAIRYRKKVDLGTYPFDCQFQRMDGPSIVYDEGTTNGYIDNCRWDTCTGHGVHLKFGSTSIFKVSNCTFVVGAGGPSDPLGFMLLERDGGDVNDRLYLTLDSINLECQTSLAETEAGGANPADRRGWYQFVTTAAHASLQYVVDFRQLKHDTGGSLASFSIFQARGDGTAAQRGRRLAITGRDLSGVIGDGTAATGHRIPLGNVASAMQPSNPGAPFAVFEHKPQNTELDSTRRVITHQYTGTD